MKRRDFLGSAGCSLVGMMSASNALLAVEKEKLAPPPPLPIRARYKIDIEIFEARTDSWCHKKGDKFSYPDDSAKLCPWLLSSMRDFLLLLQNGVTLPWDYKGTPYEKIIDANGVTTEFVRCPDPTSNLVAKITRMRV
jgi:uncharacterized repeat protein (TIGR04076 family)